MASTEQVEVHGFKELIALLDALPREMMAKALQTGLRTAGTFIMGDVRRRISAQGLVSRGVLLSSVAQKKGRGGLMEIQQFVYVKDKAFYGKFWEKGFMRKTRGESRKKKGRKRGTRRLYFEPARPFMRPAVIENKVMIVSIFAVKVAAVCRKQRAAGGFRR